MLAIVPVNKGGSIQNVQNIEYDFLNLKKVKIESNINNSTKPRLKIEEKYSFA